LTPRHPRSAGRCAPAGATILGSAKIADTLDANDLLEPFASIAPGLLRAAVPVRVDRGCVVVAPDEAAAGLMVVLDGSVAVRAHALTGAVYLVTLGRAGLWCGRCGGVALTPRSWSVSTRETTILLHLPCEHVREAIATEPAVFEAFAHLFRQRLDDLGWMLETAHESRPRVRIARTLVAASLQAATGQVDLTPAELVEITNLSRNTVRRVLAELAMLGAIAADTRNLTIADRDRLLEAAGILGQAEANGALTSGEAS
jgi:CRP-like cAMP-binding protein